MARIIHRNEDCTFLTVKPDLIEDYNQFILYCMSIGYRVTGCYQHYLSFEKGNRIVNLLIPTEYFLRGSKQ